MQTAIPCLLMRGGTSKGAFFNAADLPADVATRDQVLLAVMGSPDKRQIDGLGGAHPLTSKVAIIRKSHAPGVDLDFLFAQLQPDKDTVDTPPTAATCWPRWCRLPWRPACLPRRATPPRCGC